MERSLTQYGRGVNLGFAKSEGNFPFSLSLSLFLVGNSESGEAWKTRDDLSTSERILMCVFKCESYSWWKDPTYR